MKWVWALAGWMLWSTVSLHAQEESRVEGHIIAHFSTQVDIPVWLKKWNSEHSDFRLSHARSLGHRQRIHLLEVDETHFAQTIQLLQQSPDVKAVQGDYRVQARDTEPNDLLYGEQFNLDIIQAPKVWDETTGGLTVGGDEVVLAIFDFGFDVNHIDLVDNIWLNPYETSNNVDDDGNGYVDDVIGWNFENDSNTHNSLRHGMGVAGIVGASGNNGEGISGINWNTKLMLLSFSSLVSEIIEGLEYILEQRVRYNNSNGTEGAFVVAVNESFGIDRQFCTQQPVWGALHDELGEAGVIPVVAVENDNYNVDIQGDMPGTCPSIYQLTVTNTTEEDRLHSTAAFGPLSVDLGAPGQEALSLSVNDQYAPFVGTSSATPHVTGAIGLLYTLPCGLLSDNVLTQPAETALFVRDAILNGVDSIADLAGKTTTGGRLNIFKSLEYIQASCGSSSGPLEIQKLYPNPTTADITLEYETPDFEPYAVRIYNVLGQEVYRDEIEPARFGRKRYQASLDFLQNGTYFLMLEGREAFKVHKFIVH